MRVELLSTSAFVYTGTARLIPPGEWQVFCHHGGAYAVSVGVLAEGARVAFHFERATQVKSAILGDMSWALMYWWMRYNLRSDQQLERVRVAEGAWDRLRSMGPAPPAAAAGH